MKVPQKTTVLPSKVSNIKLPSNNVEATLMFGVFLLVLLTTPATLYFCFNIIDGKKVKKKKPEKDKEKPEKEKEKETKKKPKSALKKKKGKSLKAVASKKI